ncbi:protein-L-isoaspartate(D-aspartate) O-methyltransferase [Desulfosediminicola flagellatus]|uniref:protein-L-isoaspartate(D-aspartate) O-methyltransferase n=1 Tax=Desulfosediminicola flagellatus TaxID=2569541 RepID=UPI0010AC8763|nr:protein-L-isoaspartate(D-aspartate) O-methyltransferase [Desulfosediminicola flagellatus]
MSQIRQIVIIHPRGLITLLFIIIAVILQHLLFVRCISASDFPKGTLDKEMRKMLATIESHGMKDTTVLKAMASVPRHMFVPEKYRKFSYHDSPLGIGFGQTISQPYIVAEMTRLLKLTPDSKVLEIGTGSGYQAAVLSELSKHVYSIEIVKPLLEHARKNLAAAGYTDVKLRYGDGYHGWPEAAPFSAIVVTCAAGHIPPPLLEQLAIGGRMVIPVGKRFGTQYLILVTKNLDGAISSRNILPVRFVPLVRK